MEFSEKKPEQDLLKKNYAIYFKKYKNKRQKLFNKISEKLAKYNSDDLILA